MAKRRPDRESQERIDITSRLAIFFLCLFVVKSSFGAISGSRSLLASSILTVFGALAAIVALLRVTRTLRFKRNGAARSGKAEFILVTFVSLGIVVAAVALFCSSLHLVFSHTLFPPGMSAAWTAALVAAAIWGVSRGFRQKMDASKRKGLEEVFTLLDADCLVSILVVIVVLLSRMGWTALDGGFAILEEMLIMAVGILFLYRSLTTILDVSCSPAIVSQVRATLSEIDGILEPEELRVTRLGEVLEIVAIFRMPEATPIGEAKRLVADITGILSRKFPYAHEVYVGFRIA